MVDSQILDDDSSVTRVDIAGSKRLTVTFEDLSVRVFGQGENFGSTCLSVLSDVFRFGSGKGSKRVGSILVLPWLD